MTQPGVPAREATAVSDNSNRHPLQAFLSACLPLAILGAGLLGAAGDPSSALAGGTRTSGGDGLAGSAAGATQDTTSPVAGTAPQASVHRVGGVLSVSGAGITLQSPQIGLLNGTVSFTGTVARAKPGETIVIQRQSSLPGYWTQTASAPIGAGGAFSSSWRASQSGPLAVRAVLEPPPTSDSSSGGLGLPTPGTTTLPATLPTTPTVQLTVYRGATATIYGPGLYGHPTACGERLTRSTLGVASRTLRCGSLVAVYHLGRVLVVPVIDRGPFTKLASWDLTMATAKALGIATTTRIGTLSPPPLA